MIIDCKYKKENKFFIQVLQNLDDQNENEFTSQPLHEIQNLWYKAIRRALLKEAGRLCIDMRANSTTCVESPREK